MDEAFSLTPSPSQCHGDSLFLERSFSSVLQAPIASENSMFTEVNDTQSEVVGTHAVFSEMGLTAAMTESYSVHQSPVASENPVFSELIYSQSEVATSPPQTAFIVSNSLPIATVPADTAVDFAALPVGYADGMDHNKQTR